MVTVRRAPVAGELAIDLRAPVAGVSEFFEDQNSRAFSHDETVPVPIKGPARPLWLGIPQAQGFHR